MGRIIARRREQEVAAFLWSNGVVGRPTLEAAFRTMLRSRSGRKRFDMTIGLWAQARIDAARSVRFSVVLDHLGAHHKPDPDYRPPDPARRSRRVRVSYQGGGFRFILLAGEKLVDELPPEGAPQCGGGRAADFVRAAKMCPDALGEERWPQGFHRWAAP